MREHAVILRSLLCTCLGLALLACATPPKPREIIEPAQDWLEALAVRCQSPLRAEDIGDDVTPAQLRFAQRVNALEGAISRRPLVGGSRVSLLVDGPATHAAQLEAIARARHHIHLNTYILTDDTIARRYLEVFRERLAAGVEVRLLYDSFGGLGAGREFLETLRAAGAQLHEYSPLNPLQEPQLWRISRRHHRKMLVVDGRVAFTGGINISDVYLDRPKRSAAPKEFAWRDTNIRVEGPAAAEFQRLYLEGWQDEAGAVAEDPGYFPKVAPAGRDRVRAVTRNGQDLSQLFLQPLTNLLRGERPDPADNAIYGSYVAAIVEARSRIWITQAYFDPNADFIALLKQAAARGVDVRLLLSGKSDVGLVLHASRSHYADLLAAGVRIWEYQASILHAKTAVVDGIWATVGSSNLDYRSFIHNDEANAIVIGRDFAQDMERMYLRDLESAKPIDAATWGDRPLKDRLRERMTRLLHYWI